MKVLTLVEKDKLNDKLFVGWGGVYLVDGDTLFDTGERWEYLKNNAEILGVDLSSIKNVVVSHNHWDHVGGLSKLLVTGIENAYIVGDVAVPSSFTGKVFSCSDFTEIKKNVYVTGSRIAKYKDKDIAEQSLVIKTENGLSIIFGCAHHGLLEVVADVMSHFNVKSLHAVLGGFHLIDEDSRVVKCMAQQLKELNVKNVMPCHCTGYDAYKIFESIFSDGCQPVMAGSEFIL
ncbi:MAG: MBL fold metallo-hydrolase [Candidatus Omnitrophica bacterium]|nr:MBL fold metallo-hydrolase [Candidatus Omnitrophota bacterium]